MKKIYFALVALMLTFSCVNTTPVAKSPYAAKNGQVNVFVDRMADECFFEVIRFLQYDKNAAVTFSSRREGKVKAIIGKRTKVEITITKRLKELSEIHVKVRKFDKPVNAVASQISEELVVKLDK
jgi:hypothetical protein